MDHRCLYGHRVPSEFSWAIQNRLCPSCGSRTVSVDGYQLARGLAQDIPLDARAAFDVVRYLEDRYDLKKREEDEVEASVAEIELSEADEGAEGDELGAEDLEIRPVAPPVTSSPDPTPVEPVALDRDADDEATVIERVSPAESDAEEAFFAQ